MKIIDRYIFGKFLKIFFWCYFSLVGFYIVIDLSSNISDFAAASNSFSHLVTSIIAYYFLDSFVIVDMAFPLLVVLAALTATTMMSLSNEIIALLAMGMSPGRMLIPILVGAIGVSCLFTAIREIYLPNHLVWISAKPADFMKRSDEFSVVRAYDYFSQISIDGDKIIKSENRLIKPSFLLRKNLNRYGNRLMASDAVYLETQGDRRSGWLLSDVTSPSDLLTNKSLQDAETNETIVFSPADTPWLKENEVFVATSLTPTYLIAGENWLQYASVGDLYKALNDPTFKNEALALSIRVHSRYWRPLTDLIPLFLAVPLIFLKNDRKIFNSIIRGIFLTVAYAGSQYVSAYIGEKTGIAFIGIWGPTFIFVPIAAIILGELLKKSSTPKEAIKGT